MAIVIDLTPPDIILEFKKGTTLRQPFFYLNEDGTSTDLTGYSARMQARLDETSEVLTGFDLTTENGGLEIFTVASYAAKAGSVLSNGTVLESDVVYVNPYGVKLNVSSSVTTAIDWDKAMFDIELIEPSGDVLPFVQGYLRPKYEITR